MHKALERMHVNKNHKFIKRPVLTKLHKFVTCTKMSLYSTRACAYMYNTYCVGGSEKFHDKQEFFFQELVKHHRRQNRNEIKLTINRFNVLESVSAQQ